MNILGEEDLLWPGDHMHTDEVTTMDHKAWSGKGRYIVLAI
jgi:hypothetical protein